MYPIVPRAEIVTAFLKILALLVYPYNPSLLVPVYSNGTKFSLLFIFDIFLCLSPPALISQSSLNFTLAKLCLLKRCLY